MRAAIRIVQTVLLVIIAVLILMCGLLIFSKYVTTSSDIDIMGYTLVSVKTDEMEPTISKGDLLITAEKEEYRTGVVITHIDGGETSISRIVGEHAEGVIIRADSTTSEEDESLLDTASIRGEVLVNIAYLGILYNLLQNPFFLIALLILALAIIFLPRLAFRV